MVTPLVRDVCRAFSQRSAGLLVATYALIALIATEIRGGLRTTQIDVPPLEYSRDPAVKQ